MYKNVIPGLVSLDTNLKNIKGFYLSSDLDFYKETKTEHLFHYTVSLDNNIEEVNCYDFRNGFFSKDEKFYYYNRGFNLKFKYDYKNKKFFISKLYSRLPFEIGRIFPIGKHIADMIDFNLFLSGFIVFRGSSCFNYNGQNIAIIAPSFNGKTTFLKKMLKKQNVKYISEDNLILNINDKKVYPTSPSNDGKMNFIGSGRKQSNFKKNLNANNIICEGNLPINKLFIIVNSADGNQCSSKDFFEIFMLKSLYFLEDFFVRSYIFENKLTFNFYNQLLKIKKADIDFIFLNIKNFNFDLIFNH